MRRFQIMAASDSDEFIASWEKEADAFYRITNHMRPGKDDARGIHTSEERNKRWHQWLDDVVVMLPAQKKLPHHWSEYTGPDWEKNGANRMLREIMRRLDDCGIPYKVAE